MSHQIYYYLHPDDVRSLEEALRRTLACAVLHYYSDREKPRTLESLEWWEDGRRWTFLCLARPEDLKHVKLTAVPAQSRWCIDIEASPVIEFGTCASDETVIRRDRAYYVDRFTATQGGRSEVVVKSAEFRSWARSVFATIKRCLRRVDSEYVGRVAEAWGRAGGRLDDGFGHPLVLPAGEIPGRS